MATKKLIAISIVYCNELLVAQNYCFGLCCNDLHKTIFIVMTIYCNDFDVIATTFFVAVNVFSCSDITYYLSCITLIKLNDLY
jgi:hypothetical protein